MVIALALDVVSEKRLLSKYFKLSGSADLAAHRGFLLARGLLALHLLINPLCFAAENNALSPWMVYVAH